MQLELTSRGFRHVELWPPAVDSALFHPSRRSELMRNRLSGGRPQKPLLLTVSRLAPEKNVGFLAGVMRQLPEASLAIVGDGPERPALERRFAGLDANFIGYLKGEELAAAYASADAFVYASETETMGNVVLEAMAAGCPVIAPHAGGIPNLVDHGVNGFLYQPRDVSDAVNHIRAVLDDPGMRTEIGRAAHHAVSEGNWERSVAKVRQVYETAIRRGEGKRAKDTWQQRVSQMVTYGMVSAFRTVPGKEKRPRARTSAQAEVCGV